MIRPFAKQIRAGRATKRLSQDALADAVGVTRQAVSGWENGLQTPTGANLAGLEQVLGITLGVAEATTANDALRELHGRSLELESLQAYVMERQRALSGAIQAAATPTAERRAVPGRATVEATLSAALSAAHDPADAVAPSVRRRKGRG